MIMPLGEACSRHRSWFVRITVPPEPRRHSWALSAPQVALCIEP